MKKALFFLLTMALFLFANCGTKTAQAKADENKNDTVNMEQASYIKADIYDTSDRPLKVTLVGHGSLMFEYNGKVIHVDPYSQVADYSRLPKADLIMLTHEHADHLDTVAINAIKKENTNFFISYSCYEPLKNRLDTLNNDLILRNWERITYGGIHIKAVPAYNIVNKKPDGEAYHPQGRGNGYVLEFGDKTVYVAGDTENIPEMNKLKGEVDIAFMPKNLPYTMSDDMFIDAAKRVQPKVLYPYHMSEFDQEKIGKALEGTNIKIEVRPMKN